MRKMYLLVRGQGKYLEDMGMMIGGFQYLGIYSDIEKLKIAHELERNQLEEDFQEYVKTIDPRSVFSKRENYDRVIIHSFNEERNIWEYEVDIDELFM